MSMKSRNFETKHKKIMFFLVIFFLCTCIEMTDLVIQCIDKNGPYLKLSENVYSDSIILKIFLQICSCIPVI